MRIYKLRNIEVTPSTEKTLNADRVYTEGVVEII